MSSTNRSAAREQHVADYYVTPIAEITNFLNAFLRYEDIPKHIDILDPCSGGDAINDMSYPVVLEGFGFHNITTTDIREDSKAQIITDYLSYNCADQFDLIITNPPFNIAKDIIEKALLDVKDGGFVVMLLRLNFFGSHKRFPFWQKNMPKYCFVHHERMSFTATGGTDSIEYCHMVWQKGYDTKFTQLCII
jgi:hypothetical protein